MSASAAAARPSVSLRRRSREALTALALQFLLGMAANLIGEPESGVGVAVGWVVVVLHILIAIGLVVIAVRLLLAARQAQRGARLATWGLVVILITFLAGVVTMVTGSDWASYAMATGFLAAAALYGGTFFASYRLAAEPGV
jgi:hypothetical protein